LGELVVELVVPGVLLLASVSLVEPLWASIAILILPLVLLLLILLLFVLLLLILLLVLLLLETTGRSRPKIFLHFLGEYLGDPGLIILLLDGGIGEYGICLVDLLELLFKALM
jgi:hypothetical protein